MPEKDYWNLDRLLIRTKDFIIVGAALWAIFVVGVKYYPLPGEVMAQAETLKEHETRLQKVENSMRDIAEIKEILIKGAVK